MGLRRAVSAVLQRRRSQAVDDAISTAAARATRRPAAPTTRDVAIGGQTGSTVA